jgi:V/A-type H+-transporting ATPase subunit E
LQEGRNQALSRVEAARREAAEAVAKILEASTRQAESAKRQIIGASELEVRNSQLKSLERAVNDVFDLAIKEISGSSGAAYENSIAGLIREGVEAIGPTAKVHCASKDKRAVASAIRKLNGPQAKLSLDEKPIETIGGVVLTTPDGSIRFDNTLEARLERTKASLRKEVDAILTGSA